MSKIKNGMLDQYGAEPPNSSNLEQLELKGLSFAISDGLSETRNVFMCFSFSQGCRVGIGVPGIQVSVQNWNYSLAERVGLLRVLCSSDFIIISRNLCFKFLESFSLLVV